MSRNENNLKTSVDTLKQDSMIQAVVNYDRCDITNEDDIVKCCQKVISEAVQEKRSIDILVNSAGITHNKLLITDSSQSIRHVLDTNLLGTMLYTRSIVKHMIRQKRGSIITIGMFNYIFKLFQIYPNVIFRKYYRFKWQCWTDCLCCIKSWVSWIYKIIGKGDRSKGNCS